jgi:hypothetical protein
MRLAEWTAIAVLTSQGAFAQQQPFTKVQTALNHLSVIELPEPITMAAAGSDAFDIKRHGNRVFIEPIRANVSTNLFLWTEHGESVYELEPAGEVSAMNILIAPKPQPRPASGAPSTVSDSEVQKADDMVMSRALLHIQHVSQRETKPSRDGVTIRVEEVVHAQDSLYVRYQVINTSKTPYRVPAPSVETIHPALPPASLQTLTNTQLSDKTVSELGTAGTSALSVVHFEMEAKEVAPGDVTTGVLAIRLVSSGPHVYRFVFGGTGVRQIVATVVL